MPLNKPKRMRMDRFDEQLKADAEAIPADVSPELAARLKASIRATQPIVEPKGKPQHSLTWWLVSSLTGAAALLLIVFFNQGAETGAPDVPRLTDSEPPTIERSPLVEVPLDVRSADFAEPLEKELDNLKSDLEKAREKLGSDLRFTL